ncbi:MULTISPECIES: VOC family protein [Rhizobium]|uniref:VOC family protein n=1 Tax=Rhizobium TaxID=379 RepID=UPI000B8CF406|nr:MULTISPECIES: VOC family protein [Rhizobium]ASR10653.1 hypothetical protein CHY08_23585 [Rhizobium leguminosarum bv. viciae]KAF5888079.1 VOC family protein [Rhizobium sp. PEPV16]NKN02723.1 VOC family protein [Rhizobium leguminosarum bv. viciae]
MADDISIEFSLLVEHGREQDAADFYAAAFGAQQVDTFSSDGVVMAVEMRFGTMPVSVAGSNPKREQHPSYGGPFFPKEPGAVSTVFRINVGDIDGAVERAVTAGAVIRDKPQTDVFGRRVSSVYDPFGHIWALVERKAASLSVAA